MKKTFNFYNNIFACFVFATALITYLLTLEPTVSFWDCGEFIASAYKLEVGHPPGAPLYMLLGRFFSLFAPNTESVAILINSVSALMSAFTILFLFWSITFLAKKIIVGKAEKLDKNKQILIILSGTVGALFYTFSDTFWFSAVEAEVYASSSFFTAFVFWAVLKWESRADEKFSDRFLILIAYMMGLSIGVHLLNLLAIPAIVFVYYFKKYKTTTKGIIYSAIISIALILFILYGIIQGFVIIASKFELLFVNGFGMPFNSGLLFYLIFTGSLLIWIIYFSYKKKKYILNLITTGIMLILIGYSSFTVIIIRSNANTPMDENNPDNIFSLLSYLNREQYGDRPLFFGKYYNAEIKRNDEGEVITEKKYTYIKSENKYQKIKKSSINYIYKSSGMTFFPRIWNDDNNHISAYKSWGNIARNENPNFFNNLLFFFKYQIGHMYFRYFMWNFAGKQNDFQGHGNFTKGNWISGIPFFDKFLIGNQENLPDEIKNNKSRNTYYFLPFLLGIIGLFYTYSENKKIFLIIFLLFFFTGIAIVMYLNQTPYQPRERDYAYAGSFYAFSIWIGLGVLSVYKNLKKKLNKKIALSLSFIMLSVPLLTAFQNWDDHDRSGRFTARAFAKSYLNSCEKNAILFTYGDNDTFPLWYLQEVESYRTDIKVVNLSLLGADWYINQMRTKTYDAEPVPFSAKSELYRTGKRDAIYLTNNTQFLISEKFNANKKTLQPKYKKLKDELIFIFENSKYSKSKKKEFDKLKKEIDKITINQFVALFKKLTDKKFSETYNFDGMRIQLLRISLIDFLEKVSKSNLPLSLAMDFVASESGDTKLGAGTNYEINYLPSVKVMINVDSSEIVKNSKFNKDELLLFEKNIKWKIKEKFRFGKEVFENLKKNKVPDTIIEQLLPYARERFNDKKHFLNSLNIIIGKKSTRKYRNLFIEFSEVPAYYLYKNDFAVLEIIARNNWKRPIYFATSINTEDFLGLEKYLRLEGFAYKLVPFRNKNSDKIGSINSEILYNNLMTKFEWGRMENENVLIENNNLRVIGIMEIREIFIRLAGKLLEENKNKKVVEVLDKCEKILPLNKIPYDDNVVLIAKYYYEAGSEKKAEKIIKKGIKYFEEKLQYYNSLSNRFSGYISSEKNEAERIIYNLKKLKDK